MCKRIRVALLGAAIAWFSVWLGNPARAATLPQTAWTQTVFEANSCFVIEAVDRAGDAFIAGNADASIFGTSTGGQNTSFMAKLGPNGGLLWLRTADASSAVNSLAVDASGQFYATGAFGLRKYDTNGNVLWSVGNLAYGAAIATVDRAGDIFISDYGQSICKLGSSGQLLWTRSLASLPGSHNVSANSLVADTSGNLVVVGQNTYGSGAQETWNSFAAKYDPQGNLLWDLVLGSTASATYAGSVAVDSAGAVVVGGNGPSLLGEFDGQRLLVRR